MKKFNLLVESFGYPDNIHDASVNLYQKIFETIDNESNQLIGNNNNFIISGDFKINNYQFNRLKFNIILEYDKNTVNDVELKKASMFTPTFNDKELKIIRFTLDANNSTLNMFLNVPNKNKKLKTDMFLTFMEKQKIEIIRTLTHELEHKFFNSKQNKVNLKHGSNYNGFVQEDTGLIPIDTLMQGLYFTTNTENYVKPSELFSVMQMKNITKNEFSDFLQNDPIYTNLNLFKILNVNFIKTWTLGSFMKELDVFLKNNGYEYKKYTPDQKIDLMFQILYIKIQTNKNDFLKINQQNPNYDSLDGNIKANIKNKKYMEYFERCCNDMNYKSKEMLKKISKIYGGLKEHNIRNHKIEEYVLKEGLEKEIYKLVKEYLENNQNEKR